MTEPPRLAQREPRSLQPEQMGQLTVSTPAIPQQVQAWVLWEDGVEELVQAHAVAWTKRAVRVRFGAPPHQHEVWVWSDRKSTRLNSSHLGISYAVFCL